MGLLVMAAIGAIAFLDAAEATNTLEVLHADECRIDAEAGKQLLSGNVVLRTGPIEVSSDRLEVTLKEGSRGIEKVEANGGARVRYAYQSAAATKVTYDPGTA